MRSMETLTRAEIADAINRKLGLSRTESLAMVESILQHMSDALARGENVKVSGFGTFLLRDKTERIGRNPKTGVEVPITPRRLLTCLASQLLKARSRAGLTQDAVAERMGTTKSAISRLEGAGKHAPSIATLKRYAKAVGCDLQVRLVPRKAA